MLALLSAAAAGVNCTALVSPVDAAPVRSPQQIHSVIAERLAGRSVVEIGTRNGDGLSCMAQFASKATAVELSAAYCAKLRTRAAELQKTSGHTFSVVCQDYRTAPGLDADVFTWWQETPHLHNPAVLLQLRRLQQLGRIKKDAVAIFVFDQGWGLDMDDWYELARLGWASWNVTFNHVDEKALCHKKVKKKYVCSRVTDGTYYVAEVPISRVPNHCPTEDEASKRWRSRCGTKHVATLSRL
jgi:hypothetical protein